MLDLTPDEYNRFSVSLKFVLDHEGGYVNDPKDPGGETKWGISKRYHPGLDIKNLTPQQATEIYYNEYWAPARCSALLYPLCLVVFDTAVNMGVSQALKYLEKTNGDVNEYIAARKQGYIERVQKSPVKQRFLRGWLNRLSDLDKHIQTSNPL